MKRKDGSRSVVSLSHAQRVLACLSALSALGMHLCSKPFPYTHGVLNSQEFTGPQIHPMQIGLVWSKISLCAALLLLCAYGLWRFQHKGNICYKPFSVACTDAIFSSDLLVFPYTVEELHMLF